MDSRSWPGVSRDNTGAKIKKYLMDTYDFDPALMTDYIVRYFHPAITNGTGLDILLAGDSMIRGNNVNQQTQNVSSVLAAGLRAAYGRTDTAEGFIPCAYNGFAQTARGVLSSPGNTMVTVTGQYATVTGFSLYRVDGAGAGDVKFTFTGATDVSVVWAARAQATSSITWSLDNSGGSGTMQYTTGGVDFTGSIGKLGTGLNPATTYVLTITAPGAAGVAGSHMWMAGIVTEATNGIHCHNIGANGKQLFDTGSSNGIYRGDANATNETVCYSNNILLPLSNGATSRFQKCGLYISNFGINDQGNYGVNGPDNYGGIGTAGITTTMKGYEIYKYYVSRYLSEIKSCANHATPIMVAYPTATLRDAGIRTFWAEMKDACDIHGVPFINLPKAMQWGDRTTLIAGYDDGSGIHFSVTGYAAIANAIKECITKSYDYWLVNR